jgi:hypothetical protein
MMLRDILTALVIFIEQFSAKRDAPPMEIHDHGCISNVIIFLSAKLPSRLNPQNFRILIVFPRARSSVLIVNFPLSEFSQVNFP